MTENIAKMEVFKRDFKILTGKSIQKIPLGTTRLDGRTILE